MLTGEELGQAIGAAIKKKGVTQKAVAAEFGVKPPSVQDWINRGVISKDKLPKLWLYFSDVAGPEHWGLTAWPAMGEKPAREASAEWPFTDVSPGEYESLSTYDKKIVENLVRSMLAEKLKNPRPPAPDFRGQMEKVTRASEANRRHGKLQHMQKK